MSSDLFEFLVEELLKKPNSGPLLYAYELSPDELTDESFFTKIFYEDIVSSLPEKLLSGDQYTIYDDEY